jgi:hypothetical protein
MAGPGVRRKGDGAPTVFLEIHNNFQRQIDKLSFMTFLSIWGQFEILLELF